MLMGISLILALVVLIQLILQDQQTEKYNCLMKRCNILESSLKVEVQARDFKADLLVERGSILVALADFIANERCEGRRPKWTIADWQDVRDIGYELLGKGDAQND
jgi:hypothetical protein